MKKTPAAATVAALLGLAGTANAADLYPGGSLKDAAPAFVPPTTWTGFYLGGHIGGFWTDNKYTDNGYYDNTWNENFVDPSPHSWNDNQSGVFGGGQLGYNFQSGAFVFGVEADFGVIDLNHQHVLYTMTRGDNYWSKEDGSFYADVTGRIGYAVGPALFYAKGGWAFFDDRSSFGGTCYDHPDIPGGYSWSAGRSGLDGWVVGGGIEYLWSPSWSVKAEYLLFDFGKDSNSYTDNNNDGDTYKIDHDLQINTLKVGINYHFASAYAAPLK